MVDVQAMINDDGQNHVAAAGSTGAPGRHFVTRQKLAAAKLTGICMPPGSLEASASHDDPGATGGPSRSQQEAVMMVMVVVVLVASGPFGVGHNQCHGFKQGKGRASRMQHSSAGPGGGRGRQEWCHDDLDMRRPKHARKGVQVSVPRTMLLHP